MITSNILSAAKKSRNLKTLSLSKNFNSRSETGSSNLVVKIRHALGPVMENFLFGSTKILWTIYPNTRVINLMSYQQKKLNGFQENQNKKENKVNKLFSYQCPKNNI